MIRYALALVLCLLLPALAGAQSSLSCRTITLPEQGGDGQLEPIIVPALTISPGMYPVVYFHPGPGATVGLEFWAHKIHTAGVPDPPKDLIFVNGYISNITADATGNPDIKLVMPGQSRGPDWDGVWRVFPMSTFLHPGEYFVVGLYNGWTRAATVSLAITIRECVPK